MHEHTDLMLNAEVLNHQLLYGTIFYFHCESEKPFNKNKNKTTTTKTPSD